MKSEFLRRLRGPLLWSFGLALPLTVLGIWLMKLFPYHPGITAMIGWLIAAPAGLVAYSFRGSAPGIAWTMGLLAEAFAIFVVAAVITLIWRRDAEPRPVSMRSHVLTMLVLLVSNFALSFVLTDYIAESQPMQTTPTRLEPGEMKQAKAGLPGNRIDFSRLAFARGKLYVASSVGLIEVDGTAVSAVYRWHAHSRVDEVWSGPEGRSLWLQHARTNDLSRLDELGWHHVQLPTPDRGYVRGDFLSGFKAASIGAEFWLAGGSTLWTWREGKSRWEVVPLPGARSGFETVEVYQGSGGPLVVRGANALLGGCKDAVLMTKRSDGTWDERRLGDACIADFVSLGNEIYFRTRKGDLMRSNTTGVKKVDAPGRVEALTQSSDGKLIVSVTGNGIFAFSGEWKKLYDPPYPGDAGEHWVQIAAHQERIALTTARVPQSNDRYTGTDGLWVSDGPRLIRVEVPD